MKHPLTRDVKLQLIALLVGATGYLLALGFVDLLRQEYRSTFNPMSLAVLSLGLAPYLAGALLTCFGKPHTKLLRYIGVFALITLPLLIFFTVIVLGNEPTVVGAGWGILLAWMLQWVVLLAWVGTSFLANKRAASRSRLATFLEELNQAALVG